MTAALLSFLGVSQAEYIVGDLHEELALIRQQSGDSKAARWYAWQVSRLLARTLAERAAVLATLLAPPLILLQWFWSALFGRLCLDPAPGLFQVNAICLLAGAMLVAPSCRRTGLGLIGAGLALALWIGPAAYPQLIAGFLAGPAGVLAAQLRKRIA